VYLFEAYNFLRFLTTACVIFVPSTSLPRLLLRMVSGNSLVVAAMWFALLLLNFYLEMI